MKYIISGKVIYNNVDRTLSGAEAGNDESIILTPVLGKVFEVLLDMHGEVVSRDIFLEKVWYSHGKLGSVNTLKQYIGRLRKILSRYISQECICTVPGGYFFSESVSISTTESESERSQHTCQQLCHTESDFNNGVKAKVITTEKIKNFIGINNCHFLLSIIFLMLISNLGLPVVDKYFSTSGNGPVMIASSSVPDVSLVHIADKKHTIECESERCLLSSLYELKINV